MRYWSVVKESDRIELALDLFDLGLLEALVCSNCGFLAQQFLHQLPLWWDHQWFSERLVESLCRPRSVILLPGGLHLLWLKLLAEDIWTLSWRLNQRVGSNFYHHVLHYL